MAIQLVGWTTAVENQVYSNSIFLDGDSHDGVKGYLLLTKYREPTETEVVEYLQDAAKGVSSIRLPKGLTLNGMSKIARYISNLPKQIIDDLKTGDLECLNFIRKFIPAKNIPVEEAILWLVARYGLLPNSLVQKYNPTDMEWYEKAFCHEQLQEDGLGQNFQFKMRLPLIDRAEADVLAKHGVVTSNALDTDRRFKLVEAKSLFDALYSASSFDAVKDVTEEIKDLYAGKTVGRIKEHLVKNVMANTDLQKMQQMKDLLSKKS